MGRACKRWMVLMKLLSVALAGLCRQAYGCVPTGFVIVVSMTVPPHLQGGPRPAWFVDLILGCL